MLTIKDNPNIEMTILSDYEADKAARSDWERNFQMWTRQYDGVLASKTFPFENSSNLHIPLISWTVDALHSRLMNPLFSTDEIVNVRAQPDGQSQSADSAKAVGQFANWQAREQLDLFNVLDEVTPRTILYGTWFVKPRPTRRYAKTAKGFEEVYNGPELCSVSPWDVLLPGDCPKLEKAEHIIQRVWLTLNDLVMREAQGIYFHVSENMEKIRATAKAREQDELQVTKIQTGGTQLGRRNWLEAFECYYQYDLDGDGFAEEWIFTVLKDSRLLIRASELYTVYPSGQRPWVQFRYKQAMRGPYGRGIGQELDDIASEVNAIFNQMTDAGTLSLAPITKSQLGSSAAAQIEKSGGIFPGMHIQTENPLTDVVMESLTPNVTFGIQDVQLLLGFAERVSAISDVQLGRSPDRPNQPRTYGQSAMMQESGSEILQTIGNRYKDSISQVFRQVHWLNQSYLPWVSFYRVTGLDGRSVFGQVSASELQGKYDFSLVAVSPARNKMLDRAQKMQAVQFVLPLLDRARVDPGVFRIVKLVWETFDLNRLEEVVQLGDDPVNREHVAMLRGQQVSATPYDDHMRHVGLHYNFAREAEQSQRPDIAALAESHIQQHVQMMGEVRGQMAGRSQMVGQKGQTNLSAQRTPGQEMAATNPISAMGYSIGGGQGQFSSGNKKQSGGQ